MTALVEEWIMGVNILNLLMDHGSCELETDVGEIPEEMMSKAVRRDSHFHGCKSMVSREMKEASASWEPKAIEFLTAHQKSNVLLMRSTTQAVCAHWRSVPIPEYYVVILCC